MNRRPASDTRRLATQGSPGMVAPGDLLKPAIALPGAGAESH